MVRDFQIISCKTSMKPRRNAATAAAAAAPAAHANCVRRIKTKSSVSFPSGGSQNGANDQAVAQRGSPPGSRNTTEVAFARVNVFQTGCTRYAGEVPAHFAQGGMFTGCEIGSIGVLGSMQLRNIARESTRNHGCTHTRVTSIFQALR